MVPATTCLVPGPVGPATGRDPGPAAVMAEAAVEWVPGTGVAGWGPGTVTGPAAGGPGVQTGPAAAGKGSAVTP